MSAGKFPLILLLAVLAHLQCSGSGGTESSDLKELSYWLARTATNKTTNTLFLNLSETDGYTFSIDGEGFTADVEKGAKVSIQNSVQLTFTLTGTYTLSLKIFYEDGSVLTEDELTWRYSTEVPQDPEITFSETGTNDQDIVMLAQSDLDEDTTELWVEGDVVGGDSGWHTISKKLTVPLRVTEEDGMKSFTVKYRNVFGTESETAQVEILKKSVSPTDCVTEANTTVTGTGNIVVFMSATNDGPLYYQISGDVAGGSGEWEEFEDEVSVDVTIIDNDEPNVINVKFRDIADNFCPEKTYTVTYDEDHEPMSITVEDDALWTDDEEITVIPRLDYTSGQTVEMYIHGNVEDTADTFEWIPYSSSVDVELTPVDGNRYVRVKYRIDGEESAVHSVAIYLKPFISVSGASAPYTITLSEIVGLSSLTVTGCTTSYVNIAPTTSVSCTPNALTLTVTYNLSDGTTVQKSTPAP